MISVISFCPYQFDIRSNAGASTCKVSKALHRMITRYLLLIELVDFAVMESLIKVIGIRFLCHTCAHSIDKF